MVNQKLEMSRQGVLGAIVAAAMVCPWLAAAAADPLPSWNAGPAKEAIVAFVAAVTTRAAPGSYGRRTDRGLRQRRHTLGGEACLRPTGLRDRPSEGSGARPPGVAQRAAVQGGAGERPRCAGRIRHGGRRQAGHGLARRHDDGRLRGDRPRLARDGAPSALRPPLYEPRLPADAGAARLPAGQRLSGGGIEFMRPWTETVYGVPPEQVVGSSIKTRFEMRDGTPVLVRLPEVDFIDDKAGKPVGINTFIGRKPIAAFGNSDGDLQMLQWTTSGPGRRFGLIVHHDDGEREYAYDQNTHVGRLDKALDLAPSAGWMVVSMQSDWNVVS